MKPLFFILALLFTTQSCATSSGSSRVLTASIKPAPGWKIYGDNLNPRYECEDERKIFGVFAFTEHFSLTEPDMYYPDINTADDFAKFVYDAVKDATTNKAVFSELSKTTVNGMDAMEFTYTMPGPDGLKLTRVFISRGSIVYGVQYGALETDYDLLRNDFQSMLDSYKLK